MKTSQSTLDIFIPTVALLAVLGASAYPSCVSAQDQLTWPKQQQRYYALLSDFCHFLQEDPANINRQQYIFDHYVDYPQYDNDTAQKRNAERLTAFGILLTHLKSFIDSVGLNNLDAKPAQFWHNDSLAFAPFTNGLVETPTNCLGYFNKQNPQKPYSYLLFDPRSGKLISWLLINQGGKYYFFQFDML
jgi:hypothetical protein